MGGQGLVCQTYAGSGLKRGPWGHLHSPGVGAVEELGVGGRGMLGSCGAAGVLRQCQVPQCLTMQVSQHCRGMWGQASQGACLDPLLGMCH